jgi:hypothetical protein
VNNVSQISPELVEELVSLVRAAAHPWTSAYTVHQQAKAIAAKLPPPVNPDIEEARKLLIEISPRLDLPHNIEQAVKILKRGRALAELERQS